MCFRIKNFAASDVQTSHCEAEAFPPEKSQTHSGSKEQTQGEKNTHTHSVWCQQGKARSDTSHQQTLREAVHGHGTKS